MTPAEAAEAPPAAVERVTVRADRLRWEAGQLTAEGNVVVEVGADVLIAARASGDVERLLVEDGVWRRADGEVRFARARIALRARSGVVEEAEIERAGARLQAARVAVDAGGDVQAEDARLEPCRCDDGGRPALSFRARSIELLGAEVAVIHGGTVRVFDVPVLPVPWWREPLDPRRFRLLLPELGLGEPGWSARWLGQAGVGPARFRFGPAWRQDRGFRAELQATGPVGADAALGWDSAEATLRGAFGSRAGFASADTRAAWDLTLQTDRAYAADYGPSFVDRGVAWRESRALAALGPLRAAGWLPDDESAGSLLALRVRPELRGDGWVLAPSASLGVDGQLAADWSAGEAQAVGGLGAEARAAHSWSFLSLDGRALAELRAPLGAGVAPTSTLALSARAELPFWVQAADRRWQLYAGVRAADAGAAARFGEAAGVGPTVRVQTAVGAVVLSAEGAALYDGAWAPLVLVQGAGGGAAARAEWSRERQLIAVRTSGELELDTGVLFTADTSLAWADLTLRPGRLVLGGGLAQGLAEGDVPSGSARVGYDDGCSALVLRGDFSPDRALPDLSVALELRK